MQYSLEWRRPQLMMPTPSEEHGYSLGQKALVSPHHFFFFRKSWLKRHYSILDRLPFSAARNVVIPFDFTSRLPVLPSCWFDSGCLVFHFWAALESFPLFISHSGLPFRRCPRHLLFTPTSVGSGCWIASSVIFRSQFFPTLLT